MRWQGFKGLYFAGQFTTLTDLQETALYSAMSVARTLSPTSPSLQALDKRLVSAGRADVELRRRRCSIGSLSAAHDAGVGVSRSIV